MSPSSDTLREWIGWERDRRSHLIIEGAHPLSICLLWALACELDDDAATLTGEHVCRSCSGRGSFARAGRRRDDTNIDPTGIRPSRADEIADGRWLAWSPCPCDGSTRPDTVSLAWLVRQVASMRSPRTADWPEQWLVDLDHWQAEGRTDMRTVWWLAFAEWTIAGKEPDAEHLARVLHERMNGTRWQRVARVRVNLGIPEWVASGHGAPVDALERQAWHAALRDLAARDAAVSAYRYRHELVSDLVRALSLVERIGHFWIEYNDTATPGPLPPHTIGVVFDGSADAGTILEHARNVLPASVSVVVEHWSETTRPLGNPTHVGRY